MIPQKQILDFFAKYIEAELGIVYSEENYYQLQARLEDTMKSMGVASLDALYDLGQARIAGPFRQVLLDISTNNETSFFRDPKVFQAIESHILPDWQKTKLSQEIQIWSAASSTGQEALSTAMTVIEWGTGHMSPLNFKILATDISDRVLGRAREARYTQLEVGRGLSMPLLLRYFTKLPTEDWVANAELANRIEFQKQNLKERFAFETKFDLILCRNVLIYQSVPSKIDILNRLSQKLAPGGYLILGSGEGLTGLSTDFVQIESSGALLYRKPEGLRSVA